MPFTKTDRQNVLDALNSLKSATNFTASRLRACRRTDPNLPDTIAGYRNHALNEVQRVQALPSVQAIDTSLGEADTISKTAEQAVNVQLSDRMKILESDGYRTVDGEWQEAQRALKDHSERMPSLLEAIKAKRSVLEDKDGDCKRYEAIKAAEAALPVKEQEFTKIRAKTDEIRRTRDATAIRDQGKSLDSLKDTLTTWKDRAMELETLHADMQKANAGKPGENNQWLRLLDDERRAKLAVSKIRQQLDKTVAAKKKVEGFLARKDKEFRDEHLETTERIGRQEARALDHVARSAAALIEQQEEAQWDELRAMDQTIGNAQQTERLVNAYNGAAAAADERARAAASQAAVAEANLEYAERQLQSFSDDVSSDPGPAQKAFAAVQNLERDLDRHKAGQAQAKVEAEEARSKAAAAAKQGQDNESRLAGEIAAARRAKERLSQMIAENEALGREILAEASKQREQADAKLKEQLEWLETQRPRIKSQLDDLESERAELAVQLSDARKTAAPVLSRAKTLKSLTAQDWKERLANHAEMLASAEKNWKAAGSALDSARKDFGTKYPKAKLDQVILHCPHNPVDFGALIEQLELEAAPLEKELAQMRKFYESGKANLRKLRTNCEDARDQLAQYEKDRVRLQSRKDKADNEVGDLEKRRKVFLTQLSDIDKRIDGIRKKERDDLQACLGDETPDSLKGLRKALAEHYANATAAARLPIIRCSGGGLPPPAPVVVFNKQHVFQGELKGSKKDQYMVGCHSTACFADMNKHDHSKINTFDVQPANAVGVYEAKVFRAGASSKQLSTFYPDNFDEQDVQIAIDCAFDGVVFSQCQNNTFVARNIDVDVGNGLVQVRMGAYADSDMKNDASFANSQVQLNTAHPFV